MQKVGVSITGWEGFTVFTYVNQRGRILREPDRYHVAAIEEIFKVLGKGSLWQKQIEEERRGKELEEELRKKKSMSNVRIDDEDIMDLAAGLNKSQEDRKSTV